MNINDCWYKSVCISECTQTCVRFNEMLALVKQSNIPEKRWIPTRLIPDDCDYDAFCKLSDIKDDIDTFVNRGNNLYLYSNNTGNGKTSWSIKLLLKYFDAVWPGNGFKCRGLFIHVPTFLLKCKDFNNHDESFEELHHSINDVDLVVWDDIASTSLSPYDYSQLLMYIDQRVLECRSNIYTGNLKESELNKSLGSKLASRIWNSSEHIELRGKDNR